ncbi:MAG: hypothetical protein AAF327_01970 [Cyanobacteria bacterium P01_A01_bin.37]
MQLHTSKPSPSQTGSISESVSKESGQTTGQWTPLLAPNTNLPNHEDGRSQHIPRQLAKANQFGHHLGQFQTYSKMGYGTTEHAEGNTGYRKPLQRYPDRSAQESRYAQQSDTDLTPMQNSTQPVQFIFGWILRKMVNKTMGWLFPKPG